MTLFFRPTPSWLSPGRYTRSTAADKLIVIACKAVNWVRSLKRAGSGPIQSPVGNPIKKGLRMTQVDQSWELFDHQFFQRNCGGLLSGVQGQCFTAPKMRFCAKTGAALTNSSTFASPEGTTVSHCHTINHCYFFFLAFGRCRSKARS